MLLPLAALALQALANHLAMPRLARLRARAARRRVAVLVPARDEAPRIAACVRAWARQQHPRYEVLVYDDDSTDGTAAEARVAAAGARHVRVLGGGALPRGWRGKPWACDRLRRATDAEVLVFADADVIPAPDALARLDAALTTLGAALVSVVPRHEGGSAGVRVLAALQNWAALTFVPAWAEWFRRRPLFAAANGQLLAIDARVYDAAGGFAAVRAALDEDVALARRVARLGHAVRLVDGAGVVACRPYAAVRDLWRANVRNLQPVFFGSTAMLLFAALALAALHLGPAAVLVAGAALGRAGVAWRWLPLLEIALGMLPRALSDRRAGYPPALALLHPLCVVALVGMALASAARFGGGGSVEWRGRRYDVRAPAG